VYVKAENELLKEKTYFESFIERETSNSISPKRRLKGNVIKDDPIVFKHAI